MQWQEVGEYSYAGSLSIRSIGAGELGDYITDLVHVLRDSVNNGSPLGFRPPISLETARDYWISILPELRSGKRMLIVALNEAEVVGSAQLAFSQRREPPRHAAVEKVFVARSVRGLGVGAVLMEAVEAAALQHGRTLLLLGSV